MMITHIRGLITLLVTITVHELPSRLRSLGLRVPGLACQTLKRAQTQAFRM